MDLINKLTQEINNKLDNLLIEGLKRKGYVFENNIEIERFIKENCYINSNGNEKTYYVKNEPFFLYIEDKEMKLNTVMFNHSKYSYL